MSLQRRLKALEQRHNPLIVPDGLGYFYGLPEAQRHSMMAHMYGERQPISPEEAERVYWEIMR